MGNAGSFTPRRGEGEAAVADFVWAKREELNEKYAVPSAFSVYLRIAMQIENDGETLDTAGGNRL